MRDALCVQKALLSQVDTSCLVMHQSFQVIELMLVVLQGDGPVDLLQCLIELAAV